MKVKQNIETGKVIVTYISTHWNHKKQLARLPVPTSLKLNIASRLQQGATIQSILDWIRDQECEKLGRQHLMNSQDIRNISKRLNLGAIHRHKCDPASILCWVQNLRKQEYDPILFSKTKGK